MYNLNSDLLFEEMSNSFFLYYSWVEIRNIEVSFNSFTSKYRPVSLNWFIKCSYLLRSGIYNYSFRNFVNLNKFKSKKFHFLSLRNKIIENAIFNIIFPFLFVPYSWIYISFSIDYVRKFIKLFDYLVPYRNSNISVIKNNKFLRSVLLKNKSFIPSFYNQKVTPYVFSNLENIQKWDKNISYFMKVKILSSSTFINKNRLEHIFLKFIKDHRIWNEIYKMMNVSALFLPCINNFNSLYSLLFNLYLFEFDSYIFNLSSYFTSKYLFYKDYFYSKFHYIQTNRVPILIDRYYNITGRKNIKLFSLYDKSHLNYQFCFQRHFYYSRYTNYFLFGIIGSGSFLYKLKIRIFSFLRSTLFLNIEKFEFFPSSYVSVIYLGYKLSLLNRNNSNHSLLLEKNILKNKIISRLNVSKFNASKLFFSRVYYEFLSQIQTIVNFRLTRNYFLKERKTWLFLFGIRSIQSLFTTNSKYLTLFYRYKRGQTSYDLKTYKDYIFSFFVFKIKKFLVKEVSRFSVSQYTLLLPIDLSFKILLTEFNLDCSFLYYSLSDIIESKNVYLRSYFGSKQAVFSGFLFSYLDLLLLSDSYSKLKTNVYMKSCSLRIFIPTQSLVFKLINLGFVSNDYYRPIGNVKFMHLEDLEIINIFNSFSFSIFIWYRRAFNFFKIYFILQLLKKSCFLTLSRKHRRPRNWSYKVYTSNLLFFHNFNNLLFADFKSNYLYLINYAYLNESFFLEI
uniref:Maturase n=1 Tax=Lepocinclis ovum TaxID=86638 RepID=A0A3G3LLX9_9EUGL|nr:maturase [Lepocinclis ovum]AYQ93719.1 maturase [Lepocinclis ovum]